MTEENELLASEESTEPIKKKRTRTTTIPKKVVSAQPSKDEPAPDVEDKPKKKRGRPSKAEKEAALLAQQQEANQEVQNEAPTQDATPEQAEETPQPRRKGRRTKEEIIAAAAAAAAALANKKQASQAVTQQELQFADEPSDDSIPEADFTPAGEESEEEHNLLEQLQNKVRQHQTENSEYNVWEGDPGDGTDFIIIEDLPVEDNAAIPYYDMLDNPQTNNVETVNERNNETEQTRYDFGNILTATGLLEIMPEGYGFLRSSDYNYLSSPDDIHVSQQQIRQYSLKTGDILECNVNPPQGNDKYFTLKKMISINGRNPLDIRDRISFENLTPLFPEEKFNLCGDRKTCNYSTRIVDLFSPIGKGQRSLIVAQPKTGKTILMKDIANAIAANHPEAYIMMLLIDERPEEVTDMARTVNAEVIASTFDEPADRHVKIAGLVLEKAKRLVECGHDVVIFLDSITRLARAYNTVAPASGKVLTGGVDANALQKPKRFFGAARNIENGGSLTIIATALTDTGSKMDEVIFEEFKGTGNSELQLDRQLANKRIFPAVNLVASSTRRDDLLLDETTINRMWILRKHIGDMNAVEAMNEINNLLHRTHSNEEFLQAMNG